MLPSRCSYPAHGQLKNAQVLVRKGEEGKKEGGKKEGGKNKVKVRASIFSSRIRAAYPAHL
jgi:hypothetical protein